MTDLIDFLVRHGYLVLFGAVFLEQVGIPMPAAPLLLAAGALSAEGRLSPSLLILLSIVASLLGDLIWYELGRRRGQSVLWWMCRLSLEPDSCVRRTEDIFTRHGGRSLLIAKFVPGLNTAAPPIAGFLGMGKARFIFLSTIAALLWVGVFGGLGYLFSAQIEDIALALARFGSGAVVLALAGLGAYMTLKYLQRRRFLRRLRVDRISPEELAGKLSTGEEVVIVDVRNELGFGTGRFKLPGAIHMLPEEIQQRHHEIPRNRDVVLYCT